MKKSLVLEPAAGKKRDNTIKERINLAAKWLLTEPAKSLQMLLELVSENAENVYLWILMAQAQQHLGASADAELSLNKALAISPNNLDLINAKSEFLYQNDRLGELNEYLHEVIEFHGYSDKEEILSVQALVLLKLNKFDEAEAAYNFLTERFPENWLYWNNRGFVKQQLALFDEMDAAYSKSCEHSPDNLTPHFNRIASLHYFPGKSAEEIMALCKAWQEKNRPINFTRAVAKNQSPNKRLRLGLISDGFRIHPVGNMISAAMTQVPASQIEFYAYSTNKVEDIITHRIKSFCAKWQCISDKSDKELSDILRDDEIDILFDLNGYNENSRMMTFLTAPAPVQIKWVGGLISSTGLETMDYLLSDKVQTPAGSDTLYTEKLIRMPGDYICYDPPGYLPSIKPAPVNDKGYITFGCFNNGSKINDVILGQWATILLEVPESRLFLKSANFDSESFKERIFSVLESHGIDRERVRIESSSPHKVLLESYNEVDIALDPWPYSGGLTTCEALAMGVPVVTLPGPTFAGRHSATHLVNAGLPELVADNWEQYINITVGLTKDLKSLNIIRSNLRNILLSSPVCDGKLFAKHFTDAMRAVWQRYCEGKLPEALTLSNDAAPYFLDDHQPVELQSAPLAQTGFEFHLDGKVSMLDYGGGFATSSHKFINLTELNAFHFLILDVTGKVEEKHLPLRRQYVQHIALHTLGDGSRLPLYMCLDNDYSSDLKPLHIIELDTINASPQKVIAEINVPSTKLDEIDGLTSLEWLVMDNKFNLVSVFKYGHRILSDSLVIDIRLSLNEVYKNQMSFSEISAELKKIGFYFHSFLNAQFAKAVETGSDTVLPSSRLISNHGIWLPEMERVMAMSVEQREKLAFILHMVYGMQDMAYSTLKLISQERADSYFASLSGKKVTSVLDVNSIENNAKSIIPEMPRMTAKETALFESYLVKSKSYFEFGSGGSTKLAIRNNIEVHGVESDKYWVDTLKEETGSLCKVDYVDIGPTKEWGYPVDNTHRDKFPRYSKAILQHDTAFDLILVDGRFRVACTLNAIKQTLQKNNCDDTVIFIHDFWDRPDYHIVLEFLETRGIAESAGVFKIKPGINIDALSSLIETYQYIVA